ncbi:MAG: RIP metalloprotease RseP [Crocinitomicaceae bacterium]|nr:RIP metalloprotease RseP [Crocinitomicaceae bacterium]
MVFWIKAAQLLLSLSILVVLHEFGHYLTARYFKIRVEKFYLFFNPWFSLFKKKIGDTEWGIGWLPLGGFVKISGMIDESMDKEQMAKEPQPWEFRSKPAWQRLIVMIGGVVVNLLVGVIIYILILFAYGSERVDVNQLSHGMSVHPYMEKYEIYSGDIITEVDGVPVEHTEDINKGVLLRGVSELTVLTASGEEKPVPLPEDIEYELFQAGAYPMVGLRRIGATVDSILAESSMIAAGFEVGDEFLAVNGVEITYFDEITRERFFNKDKEIDVVVLRGTDTITLTTKVNEEGQMGFISNTMMVDTAAIWTQEFGFGASFGAGIAMGYTTLNDYASQLKFLFTKKGASSIGGFGAIGNMFPPVWDWQIFWLTTAFISIILAFMNILPIPALDGGHVVFLLYEMITGKEAPQKVLEYAQYAGFIILMGLVLYANGNDLYSWIVGK